MKLKWSSTAVLFVCAAACNCQTNRSPLQAEVHAPKNQAERLGYPKNKRILILHADDAGMCVEANQAIQKYLIAGEIQSTAVMMPCPAAADMIRWAVQQNNQDVGIHTTLTSEWKTYRWGPVSERSRVPGLLDPDGFLWKEVIGVVLRSSATEVATEIRSQIEAAKALGWNPIHMDTHMGTVYGKLEFAQAYLAIAQEYGIPAMVPDPTEELMARFRKQGYPLTAEMVQSLAHYQGPRLDDFRSIESAPSYEQKKQDFFAMVTALQPGLIEIIFHPAVESAQLKQITNSWQQRVWEAKMFSDEEVKQFLVSQGVLFTDWREVMKRFNSRN